MAAPIIPILKKIAVALVSDKKGRNWLIGILCGALFLIMMPIIAVLGIFSGGIDLNLDSVYEQVYDQQAQMESVVQEIEDEMYLAGYSEAQIQKAQTMYLLALHDESQEDGFVLRLVGCFTVEEQTNEDIVQKVNTEFGKEITIEDFQNAVQEFRDTQVSDE